MKTLINLISVVVLLSISSDNHAQQINDWLVIGKMKQKQGDFNYALEKYNLHIIENPQDPLGYLHRAKLYEALGRETESELDIKIAQRLNPLSLMHFDPALRSKFSAKKQYTFEFEDLERAFVKSPAKLEDYQKMFTKLELQHSNDEIIVSAIIALNNMEIEKAEALIKSIDINEYNNAIVADLNGKVALKKADYSKAIEYFTQAIELNPSFAIAFHNRSICYKLLGQFEKAEQDLTQAIELMDNIAIFYFTLAKLNEKTGDKKAALNNYAEALSIDEDYQEALINYSQLLKGLGEYEEGMEYLDQAITMSKSEKEISFLKANLNFVYGEYQDAINNYENYLDYFSKDPDALYNLGLSKILMRKNEEGCESINESLYLAPNKERLKLFKMFCNESAYMKP